MNKEIKQCQNCKQNFTVEPEDFKFYEKISVPPPTFCPECRTRRRIIWRNERTLYKRSCDLCKKNIFSTIKPSSPYTVYCPKCFYSDSWDQLAAGRDYDFSKSFFEQYGELLLRAPKLAVQVGNDNINSDYVNAASSLKNCYLVFASVNNEDLAYCNYTNESKSTIDGLRVLKSELCYECVDCSKSYNLKHSQQCKDCLDSWFLFNCKGCSNCMLSSNLINKSYCFLNKQYSKEEYKKIIESVQLGSFERINELKVKLEELKNKTIRKAMEGNNNFKSSGNYLVNTKNCSRCFDLFEAEDCKYLTYGTKVKDSFDIYGAYPTTELCYEMTGVGEGSYNCRFGYAWQGFNMDYCYALFYNCNNCFGCNQLRNKSYCILNRQYTKEEYEALVPRIIKHMNDMPYIDKKGRVYKYGEFFPPELSPFAYNETIAQEYFPLTKEEAIEQGYSWKDPEPRDYQITLKTEDIPDHIKDVKDSILNEIIECAHVKHQMFDKTLGNGVSNCNEQCTEAFRIIPQELEFLRKMNLPIPRLCPNCRHYQRIKQRNPLKLWKRTCQCAGIKSSNNLYKNTVEHEHGSSSCPNEFETTYAPDRPEIVYCEACYLREVV